MKQEECIMIFDQAVEMDQVLAMLSTFIWVTVQPSLFIKVIAPYFLFCFVFVSVMLSRSTVLYRVEVINFSVVTIP